MKLLCTLIAFLILNHKPVAQNPWLEANLQKSFYSGISISCADVNGDAIDDLLILDQSKHLWLGINNGFAKFNWISLPFHQTNSAYSINVADIDRNGYNDIIISGESIQLNAFFQDLNGFKHLIIDNTSLFSQAACLYDINQDGWLDFTLCDDNAVSRIYLNNESGQLVLDSSLINLNLADPSKNGGNYGCTWADFEWDGDPDLYISKCRPGVNDPRDLRRVNLFYRKDTTRWSEKAYDVNLDIGDQSWIAVVRDFDNDGLPDIFVVNHYTPSKIFKQNTDHTFKDVTLLSGLSYSGIAIQAIPMDVDNDGDLDILISGSSAELWLNLGNFRFVKTAAHFTDQPFSSCATGDFNRDGFLDVYVSYADLLNAPGNKKDKLWINPGNTNHYCALNLVGHQSNSNGVGTRVKLSSGGRNQFKELFAGESYGIQNSLNLHFGIGEHTVIDSLIVYWPSGNVDRFFKLKADRYYSIRESECLHDFTRLDPAREYIFCNGIDTILVADSTLYSVVWNDGTRGYGIKIKSEGVYFYTARTNQNCPVISNPVSIKSGNTSTHKLNHPDDKILCDGQQLELEMNSPEQVLWSTGQTSKTLTVDKTGSYFGSIQAYCGTEYSDTIQITVVDLPERPFIPPRQIYGKQAIEIEGDTENLNWYDSLYSSAPLFTGKVFKTDTIFSTRSYWLERFETHPYKFRRGGLQKPDFVSSPYHAEFINNQMFFHVYADLILDSVTVYTKDAGVRQIELLNNGGVVLHSSRIKLDTGKTRIYLGYNIPRSTQAYILTTNTQTNQESFGNKSPRLFRSDRNFTYPFFIEDKMRINTSDKGDSYYYYFYDWVIREQDQVCRSERTEVKVVLMPLQNLDEQHKVVLHRLDHSGNIYISSGFNSGFQIELYSIQAQKIKSYDEVSNFQTIQLPELTPGVYMLKVFSKKQDRYAIFKWIQN